MSIPVCRFFSHNRNCKFGKHCRFLHSRSEISSNPDLSNESHDGDLEEKGINRHTSTPQPSILSAQPIQDQNEASVRLNNPASNISDSTVRPTEINQHEAYSNPLNDDVKGDQKRQTRSRPICSHFVQHGWCKFGRGCRFSHPPRNRPVRANISNRDIAPRFQKKEKDVDKAGLADLADCHNGSHTLNENVKTKATAELTETRHDDEVNQPKPRLCKYFRSGYCYRGSKCQFSHESRNGRAIGEGHAKSSTRRIIKPPGQPQILSLVVLDEDGTDKYRQLDVSFLQKRFQGCVHSDNIPTDDFVAELEFSPSDPDWPFDMSTFVLEVTLAADYPRQEMLLRVPSDKQDLPETVRRSLEFYIGDWIKTRYNDAKTAGKAELMARPFFKWLDKNLEDLMTNALTKLKRELTAKAAGMEFIPADELKTRLKISPSENVADENEEEDEDEDDGEEGESSDECLASDSESDEGSTDDDKKYSVSTDKRGTEITLKHLQLKQNACALMMSNISLMVQCGRCKTVSPVALDQTKVVALECGKCGYQMMAKYRPSLAHALSSVVGYLDLENCVAFDLVLQDSTLVVSCLACSKSTSIDGLVSGQMTDSWCKACNAKFKIATEAVKFYLIEPSTVETTGSIVEKIRSKTKKSVKDPAIREGFPLPEEGTCRHYKQSYRWLRFPCCGKAYPCDVCHDKKEDHSMELATRMICGHCSREQNFSASRPCVSCSGHLTKIKSAHWEGGTGCRDKITMSKGDQQKYKNMNKTISNHSQKVKAAGKKTTKLRHT